MMRKCTRCGINKGRELWEAIYNTTKDGRVIGELWEPDYNPKTFGNHPTKKSKIRDFNVKLGKDKRFNVDTGTGSGVKVVFQH